MFYSLFLVCTVDLLVAGLLLAAAGPRLKRTRWPAGLLLVVVVVFLCGQAAAGIWNLPGADVEASDAILAAIGLGVVVSRSEWNPIGQLFFAAYLSAGLTYLAFAADLTVAGGLSIRGAVASGALFVLELAALILATSFVFETCDVMCRVRHSRLFPPLVKTYQPRVSLHIAAYNEPPDMLIDTIRSAEQIDYPNFEIVVVDNNTRDEATWGPVEEYCRDRPNVRFVHVDPWPGYKSGALNLALERYTDPGAEIVGVIDADYLVHPDYLVSTVGYFADQSVAFVQTPQDYREYEGSSYLTACYDAYRYFFATAMPSRNERNSIIFAGTMGLLRKDLLQEVGGWDEWCITEDAETSLRMLKAGYQGVFVAQPFGQGVMPLTFASLKSQRFRWCFGGMQILRRHWRSLMPWDRSPDNGLSVAQRLDYLFGGLQWINDLILLLFSLVLLVMSGLLIDGQHVAIRPLVGPTLLLPVVLILTGLLRALWALKRRTGIGYGRAVLAFANWLSLSLTVARACVQGLTRSEGVFLRTPKAGGQHNLRAAFNAARTETLLGVALWGAALAMGLVAHPTVLLLGLIVWQGVVYWTSPAMSWMAQRAHLTPDLERRRATEERRERFVRVLKPVAVGTSLGMALSAAGLVVALAVGAGHAGHPANPFAVPQRSASDSGPFAGVLTPGGASKAAKTKSQAGNQVTSTTTTVPGAPTTVPGVTTTVPASTTIPPGSTTIPAPTTTTPPTTVPPTTTPPTTSGAATSPTS